VVALTRQPEPVVLFSGWRAHRCAIPVTAKHLEGDHLAKNIASLKGINLPLDSLAVVCHGQKDYTLENITLPDPGPGEALVRVEAVGICTPVKSSATREHLSFGVTTPNLHMLKMMGFQGTNLSASSKRLMTRLKGVGRGRRRLCCRRANRSVWRMPILRTRLLLDVHETHNFRFQEVGVWGNGIPHDIPPSSSGPQNKSLHISPTRSLYGTLGMLATRSGESKPQVRRPRWGGGLMWSN